MLVALAGCVHQAPQYQVIGDVETLSELQALHAVRRSGPRKSEDLHVEAIQEIALSVGAQAGLAARAKEINQALTGQAKHLDRIFNFNLLLLPHNVLPPVLTQAENLLNLTDTQTIRIADRSYKIVQQARFVATPPVWRDYLWMNYTKPDKLIAAFLPKTAEEREIWRRAATNGWRKGLEQAEVIYSENLARLKRDYEGIVRYRKLLRMGMVSRPFVARTELGVTGDASELRIRDEVLRITALPALQVQSKAWAPVVTYD